MGKGEHKYTGTGLYSSVMVILNSCCWKHSVRYRIVNQTLKESNTTASGTGEKNYNESLNIL